jgi:hypothetical protein
VCELRYRVTVIARQEKEAAGFKSTNDGDGGGGGGGSGGGGGGGGGDDDDDVGAAWFDNGHQSDPATLHAMWCDSGTQALHKYKRDKIRPTKITRK